MKKPIRVLQVVTIMNRGGLETMLMNYYRKIDKSKIQFDFMTHRQERGDYDDEIEKLGGKIYRLPCIRPGNYRKYFKELDIFFENHKEYKVVHSHINENSSFVLRAANKVNIPCRIAHNHVAGLGVDYKYPFRMYARKYLKGNVNTYFACSGQAAKWLFGKDIFKEQEVYILNNAIDTELFKFNKQMRNEIRKELNIENKLVIGHVGRFNPSKNHEFLIDVFNEVYKKNKNAVLLLVGDGEVRNKIENKVKEIGIGQSVIFLGLRSDVNNIMQAMDVFVFPSLFEALPLVLIEAQASGLELFVSTGVPKEANICNYINFIDLKTNKQVWADKILKTDGKRRDNLQKIKLAGYDIEDKCVWLENFYLNKYYRNLDINSEIKA